jgi:hypothetical protein
VRGDHNVEARLPRACPNGVLRCPINGLAADLISTLPETTIRNVAIGPGKRDNTRQIRPLRFLLCASPALIRLRVPQPTT